MRASAFVEQELKELKQVREQLQGLSEERLEWQKERLQYLGREASSRKELQSWEARFTETQRRADWLQEQLDSNSREKTELFKQADQFQQLLLQKERSLQKYWKKNRSCSNNCICWKNRLSQKQCLLFHPLLMQVQ